MLDKEKTTSVYKQYGFQQANTKEREILVFTIKSGHFHNADIVICGDSATGEQTFQDYKEAGYAPKIRKYKDSEEVERELFKGFFSAETSRNRLQREYERFTKSIVSTYSESAKYTYIDSSYTIDGKNGESKIIDEIMGSISSKNPILFLIEAAAGFGKTCTAYEFLFRLIREDKDFVPLFSELSRNRQAKIFRYVLLDEIDRSFPSLSSKLVLSEITNGNVPVILDGFDELLHRSKENDGYENTEPMLETIGELLKGKAKVILTTRRTAIFDGDEFHDWMSEHADEFKIIRLRISEPSIRDWLSRDRYQLLEEKSFPIERLSNPVLLSYLRSISDIEFEEKSAKLEELVDLYFNSMLERERKRQDLHMDASEQQSILASVAGDMMANNYTSTSRDYLVSLISRQHEQLIELVRSRYRRDEKPTLDEIANKLASHALLDRDSEENKKIGFVNEFVLGNYCAENIVLESEWAGDELFIDPAIEAYIPRSKIKREKMYSSLKFRLEFQPASERIYYSAALTEKIALTLERETIEKLNLSDIAIGQDSKINECIFVDCLFKNVEFRFHTFTGVTFLNCKFYSCTSIDIEENSNILFLGSESDNNFERSSQDKTSIDKQLASHGPAAEKYILEKFWPKGRQTFFKHRPIKGITSLTSHFTKSELDIAVDSLLRKQIIIEPDKKDFAQLNISKLTEIVKILERQ